MMVSTKQTLWILLLASLGAISLCSGNVQKFRVIPEDIQILEGLDALLRCEVDNRAGPVQWTKDGFAFGFSAKIHGFPRYSVLIDNENSIYNLQIKNVSLEDDAEYQCQVGPAMGNPAIRANAKLTTIAAPTSVFIEGYESNAKVEVIENQKLTLKCYTENAYPAAELIWYYGDSILTNASSEIVKSEKSPKRFRTVSVLNLQPSLIDDDKKIQCAVRHKMITNDSPLQTTVQLYVLYPPGKPHIEGYNGMEPLQQGQEVQITCKSEGANPPAQLTWFKNGMAISTPKRTSGKTSENIYKFTAQAEDNGAQLFCEATNKLLDVAVRTPINLTVLYPPKEVVITGPTIANVGDTIVLQCLSSSSNPPAQLTWFQNGQPLVNINQTNQREQNGWISSSNLSLTIDPQSKSMHIACNALNGKLAQSVKNTLTIDILYPPSAPLLTGYNEGDIITSGSVLKLQCSSTGGNPPPKLFWYKNDKKLNALYKVIDTKIISELSILTNASDNNSIYKCEIQSLATELPLFASKTLSVHFPPDTVKISISPKNLTPGVRAKLTCDSSSSNPPAKVSWWKDGISVHGVNPTTSPGLWGGAVSSLDTYINVTNDLNGITYTCQSNNEELQRSVHETVTLNVLYPPKFVVKSSDTFVGVEGERIVIQLNAEGNPSKLIYTWTKNGLPIGIKTHSGQRIVAEDSKLIISSLSRNDAGSYFCEAVNSQGTDVVEIKIIVEYPPEIENDLDSEGYKEGENAILACKIKAYPLSAEHVQWSRPGFDLFQRTTSSFANNTAYLHIKQVTKEDVGNFTCLVDNHRGRAKQQNILLKVETRPALDERSHSKRFAARLNEKAKLSCSFKAYPSPTFVWHRRGKELVNPDFQTKFSLIEEKLSPLSYKTVLVIANVGKEDYGQYECFARNLQGVASTVVELTKPTKPETPLDLKAINVTESSVKLRWQPTFDGGLPVYYRLRYKLKTDEKFKFVDIPHGLLNFTLANLKLESKYQMGIMALNEAGSSKYTNDLEVSLSKDPSNVSSEFTETNEMPNMMIIAITSAAMFLLIINAALVAWFVIRKQNKNKNDSENTNEEAYSKDDNRSVYKLPITALPADVHQKASSTYLVENVDIIQSTSYPPKYQETSMFTTPPYICHPDFTRTLPHAKRLSNGHNSILMSPNISKDDQIVIPNGLYIPSPSPASSLVIKGGSYVSSPSPAPPPDGSYFNMSDKYITYPSVTY